MELIDMETECCEDKCCSAGKESCCCECSCSESNDLSKMIMQLANEAWGELMKEKMKAAYDKAVGDKMNKAAQVGVEASMAFWSGKMKEKASFAEFEEKLKKAML